MAKAVQKIKLSPSCDIAFNKLVLSQSNVRRIKAGISIEDLAEDIAHREKLLQSLYVLPILDGDGQDTGMFEVPAGGRRYRALELLVRQKRLAKTAPVPCIVGEAGGKISAEEDSLAENVHRVALHPLDQFRAFKTLREQRKSEEEIAAIFFVSVNVVKQRLRLAAVSPKLLDVYADDGMSLEQLMAFSVTADHARQEQVWENVNRSGYDEPYQIRRVLTERAAQASDKRAKFIGLAAYEAAGGNVLRDLFEEDGGGWLEDIALLERLVAEKLRTEAETIAAENWKWIEVAPSFPYGHDHGLRRLEGEPADLTIEEQVSLDALQAEYTALQEKYEDADEIPDEVDTRLGELEQALAAFEDRPHIFDAAAIPHAGAFISIDADGTLHVERGYVRREDEVAFVAAVAEPNPDACAAAPGPDDGGQRASAVQGSVITMAGQATPDEEEDDAIRPLPDRLVTELTAHRTLAMQDAVAAQPHVAMTALLHKLCLDAFHRTYGPSCIEAGVRHVQLSVQAPDLKESASAKSIAARHDAWKADVPADDAALWDWLVVLDDASRLALLAHCISSGVNALFEKVDRHGGPGITAHGLQRRLDQADRLARAVGLDMVEAGWHATVDNYLGRVTKGRILDAVREARGESSAQLIEHLKKSEMAKEAERLLEGAGWLPEPLRLTAISSPSDGPDSLPEFLSEEKSADADESEQQHAVAAE
ncbi:MAG: ParB N-terminal domain-containing protein [Bradyrhizobium sp.]|jgi:ParB family chromosome partitioning protein|uniref:ParB/RepB/Spo0J family partition protein n=1 Tax=Bosea sp. (in: a-proteobacteria) TaxID=1871050 RepID=UPI0023A3002B|nr:ParB N-terminal domain-containing protein [Bradyrhizobium sp.]MCP4736976.1 ParB N-terminal domain-containing protein [Bosea sp. (in: a-proteobacteria)]